jgi:hypothetical protein
MMRAKELAATFRGRKASVDGAFASVAEKKDLASLLASEGPLSPVQAQRAKELMQKRKTLPGMLAPVPEHNANGQAGQAGQAGARVGFTPAGGLPAGAWVGATGSGEKQRKHSSNPQGQSLPDYTSKDSSASFTPSQLLAGLPSELLDYGGPMDDLPTPAFGKVGTNAGGTNAGGGGGQGQAHASQRLSGFSTWAPSSYDQGDDDDGDGGGGGDEHNYGDAPPTPRRFGSDSNRDDSFSSGSAASSYSEAATVAAGHAAPPPPVPRGVSFAASAAPTVAAGHGGGHPPLKPPPVPLRRGVSESSPALDSPPPPVPKRAFKSFAAPPEARTSPGPPPPVPKRASAFQLLPDDAPPPPVPFRRLASQEVPTAAPVGPAEGAPPPVPPRGGVERLSTGSTLSAATAVASHHHASPTPAPPSNPSPPSSNPSSPQPFSDDDVGGGYLAPSAAEVLAVPDASDGGLPPGWQKVADGKGSAYYVTPAGATQWEPPSKPLVRTLSAQSNATAVASHGGQTGNFDI